MLQETSILRKTVSKNLFNKPALSYQRFYPMSLVYPSKNLLEVLIQKSKFTSCDVYNEVKQVASQKKEEIKIAINGSLASHQQKFVKLQLAFLDEMISRLQIIETSISEISAKFGNEIPLLETVSNIAEIGIDMSKFPTAEH